MEKAATMSSDLKLQQKYSEIVHQWRALLRASEIAHEQRIIEAQDLGASYRFVNKRISNRSCVDAIAAPGGTI